MGLQKGSLKDIWMAMAGVRKDPLTEPHGGYTWAQLTPGRQAWGRPPPALCLQPQLSSCALAASTRPSFLINWKCVTLHEPDRQVASLGGSLSSQGDSGVN